MLLDVVLVAGGAVVLAYAGNRLVDFAVAVAEKARLTPAVIGLTIVAAGTSAPELLVSVTGALRGSPGIAMGNVVGSNVANIGLILGACALMAPIPVAGGVLRFEYPFLLLASWIALLLSRDGWLDRRKATWTLVLGILAALAGLVLGAHALVSGAVKLSRALGVSERVVGLTVVAVGTSLPELAVSLAAALRKQQEMAMANIVGSNIFNLLMILGTAGVVRPLPIEPRMISVDLWVMLGFAVLLVPLVFRRGVLTRGGGACLLAAYAGYVAWLVWNPR